MLQKVQSYIQANRLLPSTSPVVVGVSGGADSVALWHVLRTIGYRCIVAHCNFHLRGDESDRDEQFVRQLAESHDVPFYKTDFDTSAYAKTHGLSVEMAARKLRYDWFLRLQHRLDAQATAVAHHADDNIETLLLNLIRGTGLRGMVGIRPKNGTVVRPLLCCSRKEIERYLTDNRLQYTTDSTNLTLDYKRNKIRHAVLPLLETINPSVRQTLRDTIERFDDAYTLYTQSIEKVMREAVSSTADEIRIDTDRLLRHAAYRSVLFEVLHPLGFSPATIKQAVGSIQAEPGICFQSPTHLLLVDRRCLIIREKHENSLHDEYRIDFDTRQLHRPFELKLEVLERDDRFQPSKARNKIHVDWDKLTFPLTLRHWREGDVFQPFGMRGTKKVSDFFIDNKLDRFAKARCWLLLSGGQIVWIVGLRSDDRFKVTGSTRRILELTADTDNI